MNAGQEILIATRASDLARAQTACVMRRLQAAHPRLVIREQIMSTQGDRNLERPLPEIGGKGLFTLELEEAIRGGAVRAAVHSLKDLPVDDPPDLTVGAVLERTEVRDALVTRTPGMTLASLPPGSRIGTSSLRRKAQLGAARPDLECVSIRGNVNTRLRKLGQGEYDAILLAGVGLQRLGLDEAVSEWLALDVMLPAPGQGALAVQCRRDDAELLDLLKAVHNEEAALAVTAERTFLSALGGGCALPVAAYARSECGEIRLRVQVLALDGSRVIALEGRGGDAGCLGRELAAHALAAGAAYLLQIPR